MTKKRKRKHLKERKNLKKDVIKKIKLEWHTKKENFEERCYQNNTIRMTWKKDVIKKIKLEWQKKRKILRKKQIWKRCYQKDKKKKKLKERNENKIRNWRKSSYHLKEMNWFQWYVNLSRVILCLKIIIIIKSYCQYRVLWLFLTIHSLSSIAPSRSPRLHLVFALNWCK